MALYNHLIAIKLKENIKLFSTGRKYFCPGFESSEIVSLACGIKMNKFTYIKKVTDSFPIEGGTHPFLTLSFQASASSGEAVLPA